MHKDDVVKVIFSRLTFNPSIVIIVCMRAWLVAIILKDTCGEKSKEIERKVINNNKFKRQQT